MSLVYVQKFLLSTILWFYLFMFSVSLSNIVILLSDSEMTAEEIIVVGSLFCQPGEFTVLQDGKYTNTLIKGLGSVGRVTVG